MLSACLSAAFPNKTKHSPYSCFLGVCIHLWGFSFSFCLVLYCNFVTHYSTMFLFFSPLLPPVSFVPLLSFFQSLLKPFLMSSYPKPNLLFFPLFKSLRWFIKTDKTPTYFTSQHSEEVFLLLCNCGEICISVRSGVCDCVSDLWLSVCACIWCGARSRAVSHHLLAPRQQHLHT